MEAALALKNTMQMKLTPSSWYSKYRTMDDLCLSIRLFRSLNKEASVDDKLANSFPEILETAEESVINQLTEILMEELQKGFGKDKIGRVIRSSGDIVGSAPTSRKNHYEYGILDLIQQHIQPLDSGKINYKVMEVCLQVAKLSPYSYLRCKAFELLATMSSKPGIGQVPIQRVNDLLGQESWPLEVIEKVETQWRIMRKRAVDVDCYLTALRNKSPYMLPQAHPSHSVFFLLALTDRSVMRHLQIPQQIARLTRYSHFWTPLKAFYRVL